MGAGRGTVSVTDSAQAPSITTWLAQAHPGLLRVTFPRLSLLAMEDP